MKTKFIVLTDTHFFENAQGATGELYDEYMKTQNKCYHETKAINEAVFDFLEKTDIAQDILICGDLSFNGDLQSHLSFIKLLEKVKASGKRIHVITARHDFNDAPTTFLGDEIIDLQPTSRDQLFDLYNDFSFNTAYSVHRESLSYTTDIGENIRVFALNGDGESKDDITYTKDQIKWIKLQLKQAREQNKIMVGMNHIPLLGGQPILSLIKNAMQKNAAKIIDLLADGGLHVVFTGHMHNQSINRKVTEKGNVFYDVCTSSIVAAPSCMRLITVHDETLMQIGTIKTPDFDYDTDGKTCEQYLKDVFDGAILNTISQLQDSPEKMIHEIGNDNGEKLKSVIAFFGKILNNMTVGTVCKLLFIKCDSSVKDMLFKDLLAEVVREIFHGNQTFKQGTAKGDIFLKIAKRFNFIKLKNTDGEKVELYYLIKHSIGNYGVDDWDCVIRLED